MPMDFAMGGKGVDLHLGHLLGYLRDVCSPMLIARFGLLWIYHEVIED